MDTKTLSAAQIRYLRIGPRANQSKILKQQLVQAIQEQKKQEGSEFQNGVGHLNRIPKYGYSQLSKTVNNFGVLINHNFGTSSTIHQMQKFGKLAKQVDKIMQDEKDRPLEQGKRNSGSRVNDKEDKRTLIKSIYNYQGQKVFVLLHSFSLEAIGQNYKEVFPFSTMKLLVSKVGSTKLTNTIESALRFETETVEVNYDKIKEKAGPTINSEQKYQNFGYKFEKIGTQFKINLPYIEFTHIESNFNSVAIPSNKDILDILNEEFDNVHDIVYKYFDHEGFAKALDQQAGSRVQEYAEKQNQGEEQRDQNEMGQGGFDENQAEDDHDSDAQ